jgi:steroid 5-alpha reductase family enzyme
LALLLHTSGSHQDFLRHALLAYGACIVSFVGAVHWGIGISTLNKSHLGLGWSVVPSIAAWVALSIDKSGSLVAMAAILVGCLAADLKFYKAGELPRWYFRMRIALTTIGALSLIAGML